MTARWRNRELLKTAEIYYSWNNGTMSGTMNTSQLSQVRYTHARLKQFSFFNQHGTVGAINFHSMLTILCPELTPAFPIINSQGNVPVIGIASLILSDGGNHFNNLWNVLNPEGTLYQISLVSKQLSNNLTFTVADEQGIGINPANLVSGDTFGVVIELFCEPPNTNIIY